MIEPQGQHDDRMKHLFFAENNDCGKATRKEQQMLCCPKHGLHAMESRLSWLFQDKR